jgi:transcription elongation factor Elf1
MVARMKHAQQFICNKCNALANVQTYEQTRDGTIYCQCEHCGAKNQVVRIDLSASQPALLPVTKLIQ